jgi:hypothetical protein
VATQCSAGKGSLKVERIDDEDRVWYTTFQGGGQAVEGPAQGRRTAAPAGAPLTSRASWWESLATPRRRP